MDIRRQAGAVSGSSPGWSRLQQHPAPVTPFGAVLRLDQLQARAVFRAHAPRCVHSPRSDPDRVPQAALATSCLRAARGDDSESDEESEDGGAIHSLFIRDQAPRPALRQFEQRLQAECVSRDSNAPG